MRPLLLVLNEVVKSVPLDPIRIDPTRTTNLRRSFMNDMRRRFNNLRKSIDKWVGEQDELGLEKRTGPAKVFNKKYEFSTDAKKVAGFQNWFGDQVNRELLSVLPGTKDPWTAKYVDSAHRQGVTRAFIDTHKEALAKNSDFYAGTKEQFLKDAFNAPEMLSKVELLHTRSFDDLKDITSTMSKDMNRILADGMANGKGPREMARELRKGVSGLEKKRAMTIARTEIIHAHAEGQLDGFEELGVEEVGLMAEILTAGDTRVCPQCQGESGNVYTVKAARGMIPFHPNCRCAYIPSLEVTRPKKGKGLFPLGKKMDKPDAPLQELFGHKTTAVIRRLGVEGWNAKDARVALENMGVPNIAEATIKTQLYHGRKGSGGDPAPLTADQLKQLLDAKLKGGGAVKPPLPPKPDPVVKLVKTPKTPKQPKTGIPLPKPPAPTNPLGSQVRTPPSNITFTGDKQTKLAHAVWDKVESGVNDSSDVRFVGQLVHDDIRSQSLPSGKTIGEMYDATKAADKISKETKEVVTKLLDKGKANTSEYQVAFKKYSEAVKTRTDAATEIEKYKKEIRDATANSMQKVRDFKQMDLRYAKDPVPMVSPQKFDPRNDDGVHKMINEATAKHPADWMNSVRDKYDLTSHLVERGYAYGKTGECHVSGDDYGTRAACAVHELSHMAENRFAKIGLLEKNFMESRIRGKTGDDYKLSKLSNDPDRAHEVAYKDDFIDHYMGRVYGSAQNFEILSMGAERVADHRCLELMYKDPDYFNFVIGLMVGI